MHGMRGRRTQQVWTNALMRGGKTDGQRGWIRTAGGWMKRAEEELVARGRAESGGPCRPCPCYLCQSWEGQEGQGSGWKGPASLSCIKIRPLTNDWYSVGLGDTLLQPISQQPHPHCVSLLGRGGMIQTCEQYQFVHHVMSLYEKQLSCQSLE